MVKKIYVAVDATDEVIEAACACKADMLITHHPLIFGGRMKITNEDFIGRRLLKNSSERIFLTMPCIRIMMCLEWQVCRGKC